jgi:hypothetical protein
LHLTPLPLALQMRPDLSHIDRRAEESRRAAAASSATKQASRVQKQARRRAEADMARHTMSISQLSDIRQIDTPFPLEPFRETSGIEPSGEDVDARAVVEERLVSPQADADDAAAVDPGSAPERAVSVLRYVASLGTDAPDSLLAEASLGDKGAMPQRFGYAHGAGAGPEATAPRSQLLKLAVTELWTLPMKQCLCELLRRAGSLPHRKIVELAVGRRPDVDTSASRAVMGELAVAELRHLARLLRGCWVARTELWLRESSIRHDAAQDLLSASSLHAQSYSEAGRIKLTRDAVLAAFHSSSVVRRSDLCGGLPLDAKAVRAVLLEVARFVPYSAVAAAGVTLPPTQGGSGSDAEDRFGLDVDRFGVWVWRWEGSEDTALKGSSAALEAEAEDAKYWAAQLQVATKVMQPTSTVDESDADYSDAEGVASASQPASSPHTEAGLASASSPLPSSPAKAKAKPTPHRRADAAASAVLADDDSDGEAASEAAAGVAGTASSSEDEALDPAAVADSTIAAILEVRSTTRKGDVKAKARKDHDVTLDEQVLTAAMERAGLTKVEGSRGFYAKQ